MSNKGRRKEKMGSDCPSSTRKTRAAKAITAAFATLFLLAAGTVLAQTPVTVEPESLAFGNQQNQTSSSPQSVTVSNLQNAPLNFSSIQTSGDFKLYDNKCGSHIPAGSKCVLQMLFHPTSVGPLQGTLSVADDTSNSPQSVALSGAGIRKVAVLTYRYDNTRAGANTSETILTPANVNVDQFGKLFSIPVDGSIFAQPLYVPNVSLPGLGTHDVIYVVTQHNWVYAFDAADGTTLWSVQAGPYQPTNNCMPKYDLGIMGTPVIDRANNTIYFDAATLRNGNAAQELHALDITTGAERPFSPATLQATVSGSGYGSVMGALSFDPANNRQRPALLLDRSTVYIGFASYCDTDFSAHGHGWLFGYDESSLSRKSLFISSPNGYGSGIWAGGGGPAVDGSHNIYFSTANGNFDVSQGGVDYGDSVIKLAPDGTSVSGYFTPFNQAQLEATDSDLGSGGIVLLPTQSTSPQHLMVTAGKEGRIYLINRDLLGRYNSNADNYIVQEQLALAEFVGTPSFWNNTLYFAASKDHPKAFSLTNGLMSPSPVSQATIMYPDPGAITVVSANLQTNGILWAEQHGETDSMNEVLHAYDATNLAKELYNSDQAGNRDIPGVKGRSFESMIVANGKVYIPTGTPSVVVFGLLPQH